MEKDCINTKFKAIYVCNLHLSTFRTEMEEVTIKSGRLIPQCCDGASLLSGQHRGVQSI